MNKLLAFVAVAMLSAGANAADKGADVKFGGSMKQSWNWDNNPTFQSSNGGQEQDWLSKNQLNVSAMTSDKLMGYFGLTHVGVWGANAYNGGKGAFGTPGNYGAAGGATNTNAGQDLLQVTEAWMWWKTGDSLSLKVGRQNNTYGSGFIMSKNDELAFPYYFDGLMARWSWDFADLDFGGAKLAEGGYTATSGVAGTDTEVVAYAANLSLKTLPDVLKKLDLFVMQLQGDSGTAAASPNLAIPAIGSSLTGTWNLMTFGAYGKLDFGMIDLGANIAIQNGKQKPATGTASDVSFSASAYDAELGVNFPEFMKARLSVGYHMSSGDDTTSASTFDGYQPLFYDVDKYSVAGIWGMGNLTNINVGLTLNPSEDTKYGIKFNMVSRTSDKSAPATVSAQYGNHNLLPTSVSTTEKSLGTVVGLMMEHNYGHGLSATADFDYVMLGNYYKPSTNTLNTGSAMNLKLGAKYSF